MRSLKLKQFLYSAAIACLLLLVATSLSQPIRRGEVSTASHSASRLKSVRLPAHAFLSQQVAHAQPQRIRRPNPEAIATRIYQQLPDIPLENQYLNESGEVAASNTLLTRLIQYHLYTQDRPTNFRLDWKLTLADYLGAFDRMREAKYPHYGLRQNPMLGDIAAIEGLDAQTRDRLVNMLYQAFTVPTSPQSTGTTDQ